MNLDLEPLLERLADLIFAKLTAGARSDLVDQINSPLGKRRHCAAVRERVTRGAPGAAIVGRKHLLSREELQKELEAESRKRRVRAPKTDAIAELRKELGIVVPETEADRAIARARREGRLRKIP